MAGRVMMAAMLQVRGVKGQRKFAPINRYVEGHKNEDCGECLYAGGALSV